MVVANVQNYTLMDILASSQFYENIITARNITRDFNRESSFCVWGDTRRYTMTVPLEERKRLCDTWEEKTGGPHHPCGFGLYTPKDKSRLLDVHYHPLDNGAIPSHRDLENQLEVLTRNFDIHPSSLEFHNLVSIVAHHSRANNITRLFFGQYEVSEAFPEPDVPSYLYRCLNRFVREESERNGDGSNYYQFLHKAARVLTATGKYRAEVVSFRKQSEYFYGLRKLEGWEF